MNLSKHEWCGYMSIKNMYLSSVVHLIHSSRSDSTTALIQLFHLQMSDPQNCSFPWTISEMSCSDQHTMSSKPRERWRNWNERQPSFTSDARDPSSHQLTENEGKSSPFILMTEDFQWPKKQPARNEVCFPTLVSRHVPNSVQHSCRSRESPWIDGLSSSHTIIPLLSHNEQ